MIDLQDKSYCPTLEEIGEYVGNDVFDGFCSEIREKYKCSEKIEYSACSMKWLMVDLEDKDALYRDVFRFIEIRRAGWGCAFPQAGR